MRLVTWNCRIGGYRKKAKRMASLAPDVLAVQEVEPLDGILLLAGDSQPTFCHRAANPQFPKRGIGLFSYTDTTIRAVGAENTLNGFQRYEAVRDELVFNVAAVWPWATKSARTSYRQAHDGLAAHRAWILERPTVVLGDFNASASFAGSAWRDLAELMRGLDLTSAYHHFSGDPFGEERAHTHFHRGNVDRPFHLDYCFVPNSWVPKIRRVEVGAHADWNSVSDHVPVIVDLDL